MVTPAPTCQLSCAKADTDRLCGSATGDDADVGIPCVKRNGVGFDAGSPPNRYAPKPYGIDSLCAATRFTPPPSFNECVVRRYDSVSLISKVFSGVAPSPFGPKMPP